MARRFGPREVRRRLDASERQAKAVDLFIQGWPYRRIAAELGYGGPSSVKKAIDSAINKAPSRAVAELRIEVEERDRLLLSEIIPAALNKRLALEERLKAVDRVLKLNAELRQLHGLDAPTRTEHTGKDGGPIVFDLSRLTDEQLERLLTGDTSVLGARDPASAEGAGPGGETPEGS